MALVKLEPLANLFTISVSVSLSGKEIKARFGLVLVQWYSHAERKVQMSARRIRAILMDEVVCVENGFQYYDRLILAGWV